MKNNKFYNNVDRASLRSKSEKRIIENFTKTFNKIKRIDENSIEEVKRYDEKQDIYVEFDVEDDVAHLMSNTPPYKNIVTYKISTNTNHSIAPAEKQTHNHPGSSPQLEDEDINLQAVALQIFDDGRRVKVKLPIEHFNAIEKAIEKDIAWGFDNWTDTTYFKVPDDPRD